jgi:DNA-binding MarR family transcriptional regulator
MVSGAKTALETDPLIRGSKVISAAIALSIEGVAPELSLSQLRALAMINSKGRLNLAAVADGLGVNPSNASRACDRLVASGLVERREDPADRRNVVLSLTRKGTRTLERMLKHRRAVLQQVMNRMTRADQEHLIRLMEALGVAADQLAEEGELLSDGDGHLLRWLA